MCPSWEKGSESRVNLKRIPLGHKQGKGLMNLEILELWEHWQSCPSAGHSSPVANLHHILLITVASQWGGTVGGILIRANQVWPISYSNRERFDSCPMMQQPSKNLSPILWWDRQHCSTLHNLQVAVALNYGEEMCSVKYPRRWGLAPAVYQPFSCPFCTQKWIYWSIL